MLDAKDIQGLVLRGYKELRYARFVLLSFADPVRVKAWLRRLPVTPASLHPTLQALNVAFTHPGLRALMGKALPSDDSFARELTEGMSGSLQRRNALGDREEQAPELWQWGRPPAAVSQREGGPLLGPVGEAPLHGVVLLYADTPEQLAALDLEQLGPAPSAHGLLVHRLETHTLSDVPDTGRALFREHFGFRDGVAQPLIEGDPTRTKALDSGTSRAGEQANTIPAGEILFGYPDAYDQCPEGAGSPELAKNGSFLVMRQLEQDVIGFWRKVVEVAAEQHLEPVELAAKLVGRWPSGAPLVISPSVDARGLERFDAFGYRELDAEGLRCPFGAHVRRCNPRDDLDDSAEESLRLTKLHRLIRRGRPYGEPLEHPLDPASFLPRLEQLAERTPGTRGLHFLCFNTNLSRQFEFVQATWLNNPRFADGRNAPDPLLGPGGAFELPAEPLARRIEGLPRFVIARGGGYFLMPGMDGLRLIAGA